LGPTARSHRVSAVQIAQLNRKVAPRRQIES
jgi:hypothetical protein